MRPYIPVQHGLHESLEVMRIADTLSITPCEVVGRLVLLWSWLDRTTEDWSVDASPAMIDRIVGLTGFMDAVVTVGWAYTNGSQVSCPVPDGHLTLKEIRRTRSDIARGRARGAHGTFLPQESTTPPQLRDVDPQPHHTATTTRTRTRTHTHTIGASSEQPPTMQVGTQIRVLQKLTEVGVANGMMSRAITACEQLTSLGVEPLPLVTAIIGRSRGKRNRGAYTLSALESESCRTQGGAI